MQCNIATCAPPRSTAVPRPCPDLVLSSRAPSFEQDAENQPDDHGRKPEEGLVHPRHLRQHGLTILHHRPLSSWIKSALQPRRKHWASSPVRQARSLAGRHDQAMRALRPNRRQLSILSGDGVGWSADPAKDGPRPGSINPVRHPGTATIGTVLTARRGGIGTTAIHGSASRTVQLID